MSVSVSIPQTVQIRRSRLVGLIGGVAVVAAAVASAVVVLGMDTGGGQTPVSVSSQPAAVSSPIPMTGYLDGITSRPTVVPQATPSDDTYVQSIGALARLQQDAAAREEVLSSISPRSRHYVEQLLRLTPAQLAAGAAGQP